MNRRGFLGGVTALIAAPLCPQPSQLPKPVAIPDLKMNVSINLDERMIARIVARHLPSEIELRGIE